MVLLALPALLFDIVANAKIQQIWQPGFVGTFLLGCLIVFALTVAIRIKSSHLADAAIDGLNSSYANTGFIEFPLALAVLGQSALVPTLVATIITVCILFAIAIILIEYSLQTEGSKRQTAVKIFVSLIKNPLLVAPALGAVLCVSGTPVPHSVETFFKLLRGAASPCALIALGLFLGEKRASRAGALKVSGVLTLMKLVLHPLVTRKLCFRSFTRPDKGCRFALGAAHGYRLFHAGRVSQERGRRHVSGDPSFNDPLRWNAYPVVCIVVETGLSKTTFKP